MPTKKSTKAAAKVKKGQGYECQVCGYSVVVDDVCGCEEEHIFLCCGKPMKRAASRKPAAKKAAKKK
jgi:hypothetical protein